jgi:hypothetical protein
MEIKAFECKMSMMLSETKTSKVQERKNHRKRVKKSIILPTILNWSFWFVLIPLVAILMPSSQKVYLHKGYGVVAKNK